jgi:hypothetical protein
LLFISGMSVPPMLETAATEDPLMAPNSMQVRVLTSARPPGRRPTMAAARSIRRRASPPLPISSPARMKKGMASRAKLSMPLPRSLAMVNGTCE